MVVPGLICRDSSGFKHSRLIICEWMLIGCCWLSKTRQTNLKCKRKIELPGSSRSWSSRWGGWCSRWRWRARGKHSRGVCRRCWRSRWTAGLRRGRSSRQRWTSAGAANRARTAPLSSRASWSPVHRVNTTEWEQHHCRYEHLDNLSTE